MVPPMLVCHHLFEMRYRYGIRGNLNDAYKALVQSVPCNKCRKKICYTLAFCPALLRVVSTMDHSFIVLDPPRNYY